MSNCVDLVCHTYVDERITDEIEALEAILLDDVTIHSNDGRPYMVETVVHPSTGDDTDIQYVCVTLEVTLTPEYPDMSPTVNLRNPRGLDDSVLESIKKQINLKLLECLGQSVVFELIELIRENLTNSNLPSGQCVICLYDFTLGDAFIKTPCYHHFHSHCLASHLVAGEKNYSEEFEKLPLWQKSTAKPYTATCPVCREPISCDASALSQAPPPLALRTARSFELTKELRELQKRMAELYQHQRIRGGIIDTEADNSKLLLLTTDEAASKSDSSPEVSPTDEVNDLVSESGTSKQEVSEGSASCSPHGPRGGYRGPYRGFNRNRGFNRRGKGRSSHGGGGPPSCASATR